MSDLSFHIRSFCPQAQGDELSHRETLLRARDYACALRGRAATERGRELACMAGDVASELVFSLDASPLKLAAAAKLCRSLVVAAMIFDQLDSDSEALQ